MIEERNVHRSFCDGFLTGVMLTIVAILVASIFIKDAKAESESTLCTNATDTTFVSNGVRLRGCGYTCDNGRKALLALDARDQCYELFLFRSDR